MEASALHLAWLKSAIPPNVGNSGVQFLVVGDCVCAIPWQNKGTIIHSRLVSILVVQDSGCAIPRH